MKKSYSKIRHIQEANLRLEKRYLNEATNPPEYITSVKIGVHDLSYFLSNENNVFKIKIAVDAPGFKATSPKDAPSSFPILSDSISNIGYLEKDYNTRDEAIAAINTDAGNRAKNSGVTAPQRNIKLPTPNRGGQQNYQQPD